jgi:dihydroorotase
LSSLLLAALLAAPAYDVLIRGGHVIDARSGLSAPRDVAIAKGRIAAVGEGLDPKDAAQVVDATGLYVTPGLIDLHVHVYAGTGEANSYAGDNSVYPDGFTFRSGVTTVVDAGSSGYRNFDDFRQRVIARSATRVLAFLNIVGNGMRGGKWEQDTTDMAAAPAADVARKNPQTIVGFKTAHYEGANWIPVDGALEAGRATGLPVMVDFGVDKPERPLLALLTEKLRPGDVYTHVHSGLRHEADEDGKVAPSLLLGRQRGVLFDVGHGGGSFFWKLARPAAAAGFWPDTISTDLHIVSMNGGMKDLSNVLSKYLVLGLPVEEVVRRATWNAARAIRRDDLGHLSVGAPADVAVFRLATGRFGYLDAAGKKLPGTQKLVPELTLREGKVVWDLNGLAATP